MKIVLRERSGMLRILLEEGDGGGEGVRGISASTRTRRRSGHSTVASALI